MDSIMGKPVCTVNCPPKKTAKRSFLARILSIFAALVFAACGMPAPARADAARVVASFYPVYAMARNLLEGVEGVTLTCLAPPDTGCLHDVALLPSDMRALSEADALLVCGAGMEGYLDAVIDAFDALTVVNASEGLALLPGAHAEHDHEHEHDHDHDAAYNPHTWLGVTRARRMLDTLSKGLCDVLPAHAERISANRDAYDARLALLDSDVRAAMAPYQGRAIVTFHEAFAYFCDEYGISVAATLTEDPDAALSTGELTRLTALIRSLGNPPLFMEKEYDSPSARVLAEETGAKRYTLDTLTTGALDEPALTAYEDGMRENVASLVRAFTENPVDAR